MHRDVDINRLNILNGHLLSEENSEVKYVESPDIIKFVSFNVNSIRVRLKIVLEWLKKELPDILCH